MARLEIYNVPEDCFPYVEIVLSKRNLLALLHKVDDPDSAKTLMNNDILINEQPAPRNLLFSLVAEPDDEHYGKRKHPPGQMSNATESFISECPVKYTFEGEDGEVYA